MKHALGYGILGLVVLLLAWVVLFPWKSVLVIGGEYTLGSGQTLDRDLTAVFARVIVEDGARVDGRLTGISSHLDLRGQITGDILAIESEITLHSSCETVGAQQAFDAFEYVILLPELLRLGPAAAG
jgi:hypothetical protein